MKQRLIAILLSALVLPGLGQLYQGKRVKGAVLIALVNLFLLAALFLVLRSLGPFLLAAKTSGVGAAGQMLEQVRAENPGVRWLLAAFLGLWGYGIIDAARGRSDENP
jgi:hypothetical protein